MSENAAPLTRPGIWERYRKWKHALVPPLVMICLLLMKGEPDESLRWLLGMAIAGALALAYLIEEVIWITQKRGRPCPHCGNRVLLRTFRVKLCCPHCKRVLE